MVDYPLTFEPNLHPALWGMESWEVSAHCAGPGVIANGRLRGRSLAEVLPRFPMLLKIIDAKTRLSVQVHPNERTALVTGGEPKTEMWCALNEGFIYAGLKSGVDAAQVERAVKDGSFEELMVRHATKPGDVFFIPGGLVHAIGDGTKLFEVQQSSNTTYRLYDWGRVGADGKPRELHVEKGLKSIDFTLRAPQAKRECRCKFFDFRQAMLKPGEKISANEGEFAVVHFVESGKSVLMPAGVEIEIGNEQNEKMDLGFMRGGWAFIVRARG